MATTAINLEYWQRLSSRWRRAVCTLELSVSNAGDANGDGFGSNHCVGHEVGSTVMYRVPVT